MSKKPHFSIGSWSPKQAGDFLEAHGFEIPRKPDGDDCFWKGLRPNGKNVLVSYPLIRKQLYDGTMRDSVIHTSGYSKEHWDLWRSLKKSQQKRCECC